jgi:hypothetical protein
MRSSAFTVVTALLLAGSAGPAGSAVKLTADQIMRRAVVHVRVPTEDNKIKMTLIGRQGQRRERVMTLTMATAGGTDRSLARFHYPGGIRGTSLLSKEDDRGKDHQWLFMPVLGRTRRIATTQQGDSFVGSEMAYEDTKILRLEDWRFKLLGKERVGGRPCWVIESRPAPGHETSYDKTHTWIHTKTYVALKTLFFDKRGRKIKTVVSTGFKQVHPGIWRPRFQTFTSLVTNKKTILEFTQISINSKLDGGFFDARRLAEWR